MRNEIKSDKSLLLCSVCHNCLKVVREVASHQCLPDWDPDDRGQEVRTEFPLVGDQGAMDSGASNVLSVLRQLDMSQPLHYPERKTHWTTPDYSELLSPLIGPEHHVILAFDLVSRAGASLKT